MTTHTKIASPSAEVHMETHEHVECGTEHPATSRFGHLYGYLITGMVSIPVVGGAAHLIFHVLAHAFGLPCP